MNDILNLNHFILKMLLIHHYQIIDQYLFNYFNEILLLIMLDLTIKYHIEVQNLVFMLVDLNFVFFLFFLTMGKYHHAYIIFFIILMQQLA